MEDPQAPPLPAALEAAKDHASPAVQHVAVNDGSVVVEEQETGAVAPSAESLVGPDGEKPAERGAAHEEHGVSEGLGGGVGEEAEAVRDAEPGAESAAIGKGEGEAVHEHENGQQAAVDSGDDDAKPSYAEVVKHETDADERPELAQPAHAEVRQGEHAAVAGEHAGVGGKSAHEEAAVHHEEAPAEEHDVPEVKEKSGEAHAAVDAAAEKADGTDEKAEDVWETVGAKTGLTEAETPTVHAVENVGENAEKVVEKLTDGNPFEVLAADEQEHGKAIEATLAEDTIGADPASEEPTGLVASLISTAADAVSSLVSATAGTVSAVAETAAETVASAAETVASAAETVASLTATKDSKDSAEKTPEEGQGERETAEEPKGAEGVAEKASHEVHEKKGVAEAPQPAESIKKDATPAKEEEGAADDGKLNAKSKAEPAAGESAVKEAKVEPAASDSAEAASTASGTTAKSDLKPASTTRRPSATGLPKPKPKTTTGAAAKTTTAAVTKPAAGATAAKPATTRPANGTSASSGASSKPSAGAGVKKPAAGTTSAAQVRKPAAAAPSAGA
ncbi:hypothetical protein HK101_004745, partial [Irineochytrium annulatum]